MRTREGISAIVVLGLTLGLLPQPAEAQRRLLERAREAAREIVTEEVMHQADALVGDVVTAVVDDGRFQAIATPWAAPDGMSTVNRATIGGSAYVERSGSGFALLLCDDADPHRLVAGFRVGASAGALARAADPVAARGRTQTPEAEDPPENPFVGDYPLSSNSVQAGAGGAHVRVHTEAEGNLRLTSVSEELWVGTAALTLPQAQLAEDVDQRSVQVAVAFRAKPVRPEDRSAGCQMQQQVQRR